jgi:hypothetical protein
MVLVKADGNVQYADGFKGNEGRITVGFEDGASAEAVQKAALAAGQMQASYVPEGGAAPTFVNESGGLIPEDFSGKFNEAVKPKPPDKEKEPDINPLPPDNGGDCNPKPPGPGPKPEPPDLGPDGRDFDKLTDPKVSGSDRALKMVQGFGKSIMDGGGLAAPIYRNFLGSILPPNIMAMIADLGDPPDPEKLAKLNAALKELKENGGLAALDKKIDKLKGLGDKDGVTALTSFRDQLANPTPAFTQALAKFVREDKPSSTDVAQLFSRGPENGKDPSKDVQRAVTNLAFLTALEGKGLVKKNDKGVYEINLPAEPGKRKEAGDQLKTDIKALIAKLQSDPEAFKELFKP